MPDRQRRDRLLRPPMEDIDRFVEVFDDLVVQQDDHRSGGLLYPDLILVFVVGPTDHKIRINNARLLQCVICFLDRFCLHRKPIAESVATLLNGKTRLWLAGFAGGYVLGYEWRHGISFPKLAVPPVQPSDSACILINVQLEIRVVAL